MIEQLKFFFLVLNEFVDFSKYTEKKNTGLYHASSLSIILRNSQGIIP